MDDININQQMQRQQQMHAPQPPDVQWKSSSLQRGVAVGANDIYGTIVKNGNGDGQGTLVIRRKTPRPAVQPAAEDEEDPYGRCLNMRLTSFTENEGNVGPGAPASAIPKDPRDPRIIDLTHSTASSTTSVSMASTPRQGSPVQQFTLMPLGPGSQFNTIPAHMAHHVTGGDPHSAQGALPGRASPAGGAHNTLPARVNGHNGHHPHQHQQPARGQAANNVRHFKPFDHRRVNLMADIQENSTVPLPPPPPENVYGQIGRPIAADPAAAAAGRPVSACGLIVAKSTHLAHLPAELRHTNYSSSRPANPQVLEHKAAAAVGRDSANYSFASSDSG